MQSRYKKILKLHPSLQELFKRDDIPFDALVLKCAKIPEGKEEEFAKLFIQYCDETEPSSELVNRVFDEVVKGVDKEADEKGNVKKAASSKKITKVFKSIMSLPYVEGNERSDIPEKQKQSILDEVARLEEYLSKIKDACR